MNKVGVRGMTEEKIFLVVKKPFLYPNKYLRTIKKVELTKEEIKILKIDELMIINNMKQNDDISQESIEIRETILKKLEDLKVIL